MVYVKEALAMVFLESILDSLPSELGGIKIETIGIALVVIIFLVIVWKIFRTPIKIALKVVINTLLGFVALILINYLGGFIDISIGVNWMNALVVGVLGVPGVALLLILQWLMVI